MTFPSKWNNDKLTHDHILNLMRSLPTAKHVAILSQCRLW